MAYVGLEISASTYLCRWKGAQLHLTLAHFEKPDGAQAMRLCQLLEDLAKHPAPALEVTRITRLSYVGEVLVVKATPRLEKMRASVLERLKEQGVEWSEDYAEWLPHITVSDAGRIKDTFARGANDIRVHLAPAALELAGTAAVVRYRFPFEGVTLL